jgi:putative transcriptional regulator
MRLKLEKPAKGKLLVAEPFLGDPSFDRTVILLTEHNDEGTVGFVLNRPLRLTMHQIIKDFPSFDAPVYNGGPVQKENLYFVHNKGDLLPTAIELSPGLYWGGDIEKVKMLITMGLITEKDIKFFLGYSGWGKYQLEGEIDEKSWIVINKDAIDLFQNEGANPWRTILTNLGGDYRLWANAPADPLLN